jgi:predicted amidohydrolase YtcJ
MTNQTLVRIDTLIRARAIYSLDRGQSVHRSLAIRDDRIVGLSPDPAGFDAERGSATSTLDVHLPALRFAAL